jgi:hypothetical protein
MYKEARTKIFNVELCLISKSWKQSQVWWFTCIIPPTQEVEAGR